MSTIAKIILILNVLSTNIYPLEADGQDGQLPTQILADTGKSLSEALLFAEHGENML